MTPYRDRGPAPKPSPVIAFVVAVVCLLVIAGLGVMLLIAVWSGS